MGIFSEIARRSRLEQASEGSRPPSFDNSGNITVPHRQMHGLRPSSLSGGSTSGISPTGGKVPYSDPNEDISAFYESYFSKVNAGSPGSIRDLYNAMKADGWDVEIKGEKDVELIRVAGHDWGWMDLRQDKAAIQGRKGWDSARWTTSQRWYGSDDFKRLQGEGRNPHTGEFVGMEMASRFTRDSDFAPGAGALTGDPAQLGGNGSGSGGGGGINRRKVDPMEGRRGTILAGHRAPAPRVRRTMLGGY